jgi:RNA polymerase sigma factor (sigma-70 family)
MRPNGPQSGEDPLFRRFLKADPDALARAGMLISKVIRFRGYYIPPDDAEDVRQETLFQVLREMRRPKFDFQGSFDAFIRSVAHRRCVDWMRRHRMMEELPASIPSEAGDPDRPILERERIELGSRVLSLLREACRDLIRLHVGRKMTYSEIGQLQGRSAGALRVQMTQCLKDCRRILGRIDRRAGHEA